ncbi:magnesium and cobalt transport protein CorA [Microbacterium sp.]|uniref:magnesium and cobalt transport protein CorA n=1 Tax=Microbacterium sp. TaxID=51671 RepID=UPI003A8DF500
MRKLWQSDLGIGGLFHRHARDDVPEESKYVTGKLVRFVHNGVPTRVPDDLTVTDATAVAAQNSDQMALFLYSQPTATQIEELAEAWALHPVLVDDLLNAGQRPKLERYGDTLFVVAKAARYLDDSEAVDFGEFHVLLRPGAVAVLCQDSRWLRRPEHSTHDGHDGNDQREVDFGDRERAMLTDQSLLKMGPVAVVYMLLDAIVDGYGPVLNGISTDREEIERQVFGGDATVTERIYRLSREVVEMQQAIASLTEAVDLLRSEPSGHEISQELRTRLDDVADRLVQADTKASGLRDALTQILSVNATLVNQRQNEDMKRISGWAAILFAPSLIGGVYGMNFDEMPELHWAFGYPFALGLMLALAAVLYTVFKRSKWI